MRFSDPDLKVFLQWAFHAQIEAAGKLANIGQEMARCFNEHGDWHGVISVSFSKILAYWIGGDGYRGST